MRELRDKEIGMLEDQGCWAEEWSDILVDDDFMADSVRNVTFYGHVELGSLNGTIEVEEGFRRRCIIRNVTLRNVAIGDECLIENVHGYISGYTIGSHCLISNVGVMTCQEGTTFGNGTTISVLNEGGDGNVVLSEELTAQVAWFMVNGIKLNDGKVAHDSEEGNQPTLIGSGSRITGVREMSNVKVGEYCEIQEASRLDNCTIMSNDDANTFIGSDVIIENSIVAPGASITDGAKVMECFVGESVHIGKGFSAESSLFFANSYMDNGESCAALCGPFSTSHHKSTLLIGGAFSFYNAGSNTNQSNHAYKMGPIHWGILDRGAKTASGCHILWPAHIGAFSMAMGKIQTHPQVFRLPFSYVIAEGAKTYLVPGINIKTVGTWRDVSKWPKRDLRPKTSRCDIINFAFPNPYLIQYVLDGRKELERLSEECDREETEYNGCTIRRNAIHKGIEYYDLIIRLYLYEYFSNKKGTNEGSCTASVEDKKDMRWLDLCGMLAPKTEIEKVIRGLREGDISTTVELKKILQEIHTDYSKFSDEYAEWLMNHLDEGNTQSEELQNSEETDSQNCALSSRMEYWRQEAEKAHAQWLEMVSQDAQKEFRMGDVDEQTLKDFLDKLNS